MMKRIISLALVLITVLGLFSCFEPIDPQISHTTTQRPPVGIGSSTTTTNHSHGTGTTTTTVNGGGSTTRPSTGTTTTGDIGSNTPIEPPVADTDELKLFYELFDYNNHVSIHLDISDSELKKIQQDYEKYSSFGSKSPIYRMADMYVTITKADGEKLQYVIEQVGVRMKGNTSRTHFYDDSSGMYNLIHFKVSFEETFDDAEYYGNDALVWTDDAARKARKNRTFATLSKIDMRWNRNDDPTYIREIYAYDIYRENGVLAPHTNLASVDIGDDHAGVWVFYEPIDKTFLEKYLPEEALGGDLYKLGWTNEPADFTKFSSYGAEDEDAGKFYVYDIKTNKKTTDHSSLRNLINTINSNSLTKSSFESVIDVESFLNYAAVSYMIGNPDDLRNNYNNSYIYFRADTGKMIIIPYDMDRGLGVNTWNPYGHGMTTDIPFQTYNVCGDQRNNMFKKSIHQGGFLVNEYIDALKRADACYLFTNEAFKERFNIAKSLYGNDATPSKQYGNAWDYNFHFDINETCPADWDKCMSFSDYLNAKRKTMYSYLGMDYTEPDDPDNGDDSTGGDTGNNNNQQNPVREWDLYLRGNFNDNNWTNQSQYRFKAVGDGIYCVDVSCQSELFKFKVYNEKQGSEGDAAWYNTVDEERTTVWFEYQGGHANVQVKAGSYTVYFDTNTQTLYIVEK